MTVPVPAAAQPTENVARGLAFALLTIPAGAIVAGVGLSLIAGVPMAITGVLGVAAAAVAHWLYVKGAGTVPKQGLAGYIVIAAVSVLVTGFAGVVGSRWGAFTSVGGRGGLFGDTFIQAVYTHFRDSPGDAAVVIILVLAGGILGIVIALRRGRQAGAVQTQPPAP